MIVKEPVAPAVTRHRLSVEQYEQMIAQGILAEDDRIELINGEIIDMSPISAPHAAVVMRLTTVFGQAVAGRAIVSVQNPVLIGNMSRPEPDVALLRNDIDLYAESLPEQRDILLLIEVSDTSLRYDRLDKLPRYAAAGIMEVWLVNLVDDLLEIYRDPASGGYETRTSFKRGDSAAPLAFPETAVNVVDILG